MQVVKPASNGVQETDEDTPMQSSPFMSSSMPNQDVEEHVAAMRVMTLAREEHLGGKQADYCPSGSCSPEPSDCLTSFDTSGEGKI